MRRLRSSVVVHPAVHIRDGPEAGLIHRPDERLVIVRGLQRAAVEVEIDDRVPGPRDGGALHHQQTLGHGVLFGSGRRAARRGLTGRPGRRGRRSGTAGGKEQRE